MERVLFYGIELSTIVKISRASWRPQELAFGDAVVTFLKTLTGMAVYPDEGWNNPFV